MVDNGLTSLVGLPESDSYVVVGNESLQEGASLDHEILQIRTFLSEIYDGTINVLQFYFIAFIQIYYPSRVEALQV